jgi:hypothetical protein
MTRRLDVQKRREWEERFERYRSGGLTVGRFCTNERVSVNTFYYWARRVGSQLVRPRTDQADEAPAGRPPRVRQATALNLATAANAAVVRFRLSAAVEVSVPANCLEAIRCLVHCAQHSPAERGYAFHEVVVGTR